MEKIDYNRTLDTDARMVDANLKASNAFFIPVFIGAPSLNNNPDEPGAIGMGSDGKLVSYNGTTWVKSVDESTFEFKSLVNPAITVAWTIFKSDGVTPYTPSSSSSKNITVDKGAIVKINATYQYPLPNGTTTKGPASISGAFGSADPGAATPSAPFTNGGTDITTNSSYAVTLSSPKSGFIVSGSQVVKANGNDTSSDSVSVAFMDKVFYGVTAKDGTTQPITDADILALSSVFTVTRQRSFTNFGGGGKRIAIGVPTGFGDASFKVNGLANTAVTKIRANSDFVNAAGYTVKIDLYLTDNIYNSPLDSFEIL